MPRVPRMLVAGSIVLVTVVPVARAPFSLASAADGPQERETRLLSAQLSQPPPAADPSPTVRTYRITYRVSGQAASTTIDYRTRGGPIEHSTTPTLPWAVSLDMPLGDALYLTASGRAQWGESTIACEILVDGVVHARASGVGFPAVATCKATVAR